MIPLALPDWFVTLLIVNLSMVFAATLYYAVRQTRWVPRRRAAHYVFRCTACGHVYIDRRNVPMSECENCGNMNESVKSF